MEYFDYQWNGTPEAVESFLSGVSGDVLGPRILDGRSYIAIRPSVAMEKPSNLKVTGPDLSAAILGVWMPFESEEVVE